ncbi:hypothetical protein TMatcc_010377 [Talaromyces marneffei ATCC 18224]|uniref:Uncharacterized protein n=1 Tax=Talaromyces marneffei (strain ATCC 18224 / CBS 334.59 / QM 7333) TaxID=441960 RepID=B6QVW7_TALMQ|nr:uncharacterized protein EYB26_009830 [Talaromyces marneffei]EEA19080.1 hypothetical protein PMAA_013430 [Talaromyces marneffei ATCC 18224]KAE8548772.1 hypothetical protein EYB25_009153 [Talaromyces marneffei]QGA22116.1 hypothetical protein EYB26_009830 [Talaromyces marneffei]
MTSDCIYPHIEERLVPARENQDYDSECAIEHYDFTYRKWTSKQEFISLIRSLSTLDLPSAHHIEDVQDISADDLKPIFNLDQFDASNNARGNVPELRISNSSSPPDYSTDRTSWGNADDIPTRAPSAALEDLPPLVRCHDVPAMGYADDYNMGIEKSVLSNWSFSSLLNADYDEHVKDGSGAEGESLDSSLSSYKEDAVRVTESKDDEGRAFISLASSTIPSRPLHMDALHANEREL